MAEKFTGSAAGPNPPPQHREQRQQNSLSSSITFVTAPGQSLLRSAVCVSEDRTRAPGEVC
jgi:hypothetical protein